MREKGQMPINVVIEIEHKTVLWFLGSTKREITWYNVSSWALLF